MSSTRRAGAGVHVELVQPPTEADVLPYGVIEGSPVAGGRPRAADRRIPPWVRARIRLSESDLDRELTAMTDRGTEIIAVGGATAATLPAWGFVNALSRLVVDPERFTDPGLEEMDAVGMGAVYTATSDLRVLRDPDPAHRAQLLERYFHPYADALADLVDERLAAAGRALLIDVHSYPTLALPYERHPELARPQVCHRHRPGPHAGLAAGRRAGGVRVLGARRRRAVPGQLRPAAPLPHGPPRRVGHGGDPPRRLPRARRRTPRHGVLAAHGGRRPARRGHAVSNRR